MENGQSTTTKLGLPPLTPNQQEALQKVTAGGGRRVAILGLLVQSHRPWFNKVAPSADHRHLSGHVTLFSRSEVHFQVS